MGIYDRDYYRREGPSFLGSLAERGTVCKWLIGINIVFFLIQMVTQAGPRGFGGPFQDLLILDVDRVLHGEVWRLLTYAFLHDTGTPWHILFNMLFLWWFGNEIEELYGSREFLTLYLVSAILGGLAFVLTHLDLHPGLERHFLPAQCLGASGAVTTVMVLAAFHFPNRIILLFFILPVPLWLVVLVAVVGDAFQFFGRMSTQVAVSVHLAGALFGFCYYKFGWRLTGWLPRWRDWRRQLSRPRLRVYREEPEPEPAPASVAAPTVAPPSVLDDEQLEAKMDAVLEKISRTGKDSLTESERAVLLRASEILRRRRR